MRKELALIALFLIIPGALAISTDMRESYMSGETMIMTLSGNILETISKDQVIFTRSGFIEVPFEYDIKKIGDNHYIYAIMPFVEGNNASSIYQININNILTTVNGQRTNINFTQNFSVVSDIIPYSIKPGIVVSSDDFEVVVELYEDANKEISVDFPESRNIILKPGENRIEFSIENVGGGIYMINIGDYAMPVNVLKEIEEELPPLRFSKGYIESRILIGSSEKYSFDIINYGDSDIENARFEYNTDIIIIEPKIPKTIKPGESYRFDITLIEEENIDEEIFIFYDNYSSSMKFSVSYTENESETGTIYEEEKIGALCSELGGAKCLGSEICNGESVQSKDASQCCLGICVEKENSREYSWIGYVIGAILIIALIYLLRRYMKSNKSKDGFNEKVKRAERKSIP